MEKIGVLFEYFTKDTNIYCHLHFYENILEFIIKIYTTHTENNICQKILRGENRYEKYIVRRPKIYVTLF